jgi:hypothetical protein
MGILPRPAPRPVLDIRRRRGALDRTHNRTDSAADRLVCPDRPAISQPDRPSSRHRAQVRLPADAQSGGKGLTLKPRKRSHRLAAFAAYLPVWWVGQVILCFWQWFVCLFGKGVVEEALELLLVLGQPTRGRGCGRGAAQVTLDVRGQAIRHSVGFTLASFLFFFLLPLKYRVV